MLGGNLPRDTAKSCVSITFIGEIAQDTYVARAEKILECVFGWHILRYPLAEKRGKPPDEVSGLLLRLLSTLLRQSVFLFLLKH